MTEIDDLGQLFGHILGLDGQGLDSGIEIGDHPGVEHAAQFVEEPPRDRALTLGDRLLDAGDDLTARVGLALGDPTGQVELTTNIGKRGGITHTPEPGLDCIEVTPAEQVQERATGLENSPFFLVARRGGQGVGAVIVEDRHQIGHEPWGVADDLAV